MNVRKIQKLINEGGFERVSGTPEEKRIAEYLLDRCLELGVEARIEEFDLPVTEIHSATLTADGEEIPCRGYERCGSGEIEGQLVYIPDFNRVNLAKVKDRIVLLDGGLSRWNYQDMLDAGALGFITYTGDVKWADNDIDLKELRDVVAQGRKVLGVNINAKDAQKLVRKMPRVKISIDQTESMGKSWNVVADIPGKSDEWIVTSCHLDSRPNCPGVYDNLSGCIANLDILEQLKKTAPNRFGIRAVFCGSEERGLLGSKAYCEAHTEELEKVVLNFNVDMCGSLFGQLNCMCTAEDSAVEFVKAFACEYGHTVKVASKVASSDSSSFADKGVPAICFVKFAPSSQAIIHARYDDATIVSAKVMKEDCDFLTAMVKRLAGCFVCPVDRKVPDKLKEELDFYFSRKKRPN